MAFTTAQAAQIRLYLGYPNLFAFKLTRLESAIVTVGNDPDASALVVTELARCAAADARINGQVLDTSGIARADDVEFFQSAALTDVRRVGRQAAARISIILGTPINADVFSGAGYPGDSLSDLGGARGGGNMIPLG